MKKILVIGGQGMLGRPVVRRLLKEGFEVRVMARQPEKAAAKLPDGVEVVLGDLQDIECIRHVAEDVEVPGVADDHLALEPGEAVSLLEHASTGGGLGGRTLPWLNENLLDNSVERLDSQRRLFGKLFATAAVAAINSAYAGEEELTRELIGLAR